MNGDDMSIIKTIKNNLNQVALTKAYKIYINKLEEIRSNIILNIYLEEDSLFIDALRGNYQKMLDGLPRLYRNDLIKREQESIGWLSLINICDLIINNFEEKHQDIVLENIDKLLEVMHLSLKEESNKIK